MSLLYVINGETLGRGDDALGAKLMGGFLRTLSQLDPKPDNIVFYNSAVKLLAKGSPHLEALSALHAAGTDLLACITCLEFYSLTESLALGTISNMRDIVTLQLEATKVVTI